jgi:hypothetical protein
MSQRLRFIIFWALAPLHLFGRPVQSYDIKTLIAKSELVFVGRVRSVQPSGVTTSLSYATWGGAVFSWLAVDIDVLEPIKGVHRGDVVRTFMMSADRPIIMNAPGTVELKTGEAFLLYLAPTTLTNVFASVTAPFDDKESIFRLDRSDSEYHSYRKGFFRRHRDGDIIGSDLKERYAWIWRLVNDEGTILPAGAERMCKAYAKQIRMPPPATVIYLQWETRTNADGWHWSEPKSTGTTRNLQAK